VTSAAADVLVVGAGPAGLAAATAARRLGLGSVLVVEREREAGGAPRTSDHLGYGVRDLHRMLSGPVYARRWSNLAQRSGASLLTETSVLEWTGPTSVLVTGPNGVGEIEARAVVLATGCRERPRSARLVPGDRPAGVLTTGSLQQLVSQGVRVGRTAVVVGAEHVSFSAVLTLRHAGARAVALVTPHPADQTYAWLRALTTRLRVPVLVNTRVEEILGRDRVSGVVVVDRVGRRRRIECDTVVFTGDWIPDHELARAAGLEMDPATRGPRIDEAHRTSTPGLFAVGNLVHPAETADTVTECGLHVAAAIEEYLREGRWPRKAAVPVEVEHPLLWVSPSAVAQPGSPLPHRRFLVRPAAFARGRLEIHQGDRLLHRSRVRGLVPGRSVRVAETAIRELDPEGPPLRFRVQRR